MQLRILGSGTTAGETGRNCSGYLVDERLLFDCGPGIWSALFSKSKPSIPINHIFLSHFHVDHFADLIPLLWTRWLFALKNPQPLMNVYGPAGLRDWFKELRSVHREWLKDLDIALHELEQDKIEVDNYLVETLPAIHIENSICYRLTDQHGKSLFYSGDTTLNDNLAILARSCDLAIIEAAVLPEDQIDVHLTPQQAAQVAARAKVKTLVLTHIYPQVWPAGPAGIAAEYFDGEIIEAEDNMVINICNTTQKSCSCNKIFTKLQSESIAVEDCDGKSKSSFAVVFDFDGTLIDSKEIKLNSYLQAFVSVFKTGPKLEQIILASSKRTAGANRFIQLQDTLNCLSLTATDEQKEAWSRAYSALNSRAMADIPEFPSVRSTLTELKKKGYQLFSASGILEEEFQRELARRKLKDFFIKAEGGDKPGFLSGLKTRGFEPILFVGDTGFDEKAAEQAGVHFYLIKNDEDFSALPRFLAGSAFNP